MQHRRSQPRFHPLVWPLWLLASVLATGSNPLHNFLVLLAAALVAILCQDDSPVGRAFGFFVRIGLVVIVLRIALSSVAIGGLSFGATPLGQLPTLRLPWWLGGLELGGPFTLEMLAIGLVGGMQLLVLLALFGAFNAVADHYGLLRRAPHFLGGAGLAITIGLAFVPQTLAQLAAIREAQRVRGHRFRSWRDSLPLLVPLVSGGMERSLQLAEAMDSRGYGTRQPRSRRVALIEQSASAAGLLLVALGLFHLFYQPDPRIGYGLLGIGLLTVGGAARSLGQATRRTRYLRERWRWDDFLVVASSVALLVLAAVLRRARPEALSYMPLPRASLPSFDPWSIGVVLLVLAPASLSLRGPHAMAPGATHAGIAELVPASIPSEAADSNDMMWRPEEPGEGTGGRSA